MHLFARVFKRRGAPPVHVGDESQNYHRLTSATKGDPLILTGETTYSSPVERSGLLLFAGDEQIIRPSSVPADY